MCKMKRIWCKLKNSLVIFQSIRYFFHNIIINAEITFQIVFHYSNKCILSTYHTYMFSKSINFTHFKNDHTCSILLFNSIFFTILSFCLPVVPSVSSKKKTFVEHREHSSVCLSVNCPNDRAHFEYREPIVTVKKNINSFDIR